ncbi:hypothetical protein MNBD_NITROSPINAE03-378 [hydrothermal vent metagenome]|uniref:Uncharacterized protein n=1 Tax=hydrothermal vent metagenome TaxID=652676 RepID=A0A3B1CSB1_9ZZZZ
MKDAKVLVQVFILISSEINRGICHSGAVCITRFTHVQFVKIQGTPLEIEGFGRLVIM